MEPQLGWVWLSQTERKAAEQALSDAEPDGTRDELGFGVIHFAYADRFFPGTSVQHTSLRYVWFVCWSYLELAARSPGGPFPSHELDLIEDRTGRKLIKEYGAVDGKGIIGGRVLRVGRSPVIKPSAIYWNAMREWGLIAPLAYAADIPGRAEIHARWDDLTNTRPRPEVDPEPIRLMFVDPPPIPFDWQKESKALVFDLDPNKDEGGRIRRAWALQRDAFGRETLLSRLAKTRQPAPPSMTSTSVFRLCYKDEIVCLKRAKRAGALAAIARSLHTAMVQRLKDAAAPEMRYTRNWLDNAVATYAADADKLDVAGLREDVASIPISLLQLIESTQDWLKTGAGDFTRLEPWFRAREIEQKPGRALLASNGIARRAAWQPHEQGPLTYRWEHVAKFLNELATA